MISATLFWLAGLLLAHTYLLYPLLLVAIDSTAQILRGIGSRPAPKAAGPWPSVSLVVAAYNEISCIDAKLENSLALDYPADRFEVLVGSDGSDDGTDEAVQGRVRAGVRLLRGTRAGKASVLNRCIPVAAGELVVLTDANTTLDSGAIKKLARHFDDPDVGAVCGRLVLYHPARKAFEESTYWAYESFIKLLEGRRGALVGANGGLYAIRRALFTSLPPRTIVDDFVIPARLLARGYKVLYEPEAVAYEETTADAEGEFRRHTRIAAGNFQSLALVPGLLGPGAGFAAFAFWSHKLLRWASPALLATAFAANLALVGVPFYRVTLGVQVVFYSLALAGRERLFKGRLDRVASAAHYFVTMNWALAVGFWRFLRDAQPAAWERTVRARG